MKVLEHEHLLKLIDLLVKNEDAKDSDEEKDVVAQSEFAGPCKRCDLPINDYYRYYYKCEDNSCDFSLHKFCAEALTKINHTSHSHPLRLRKYKHVPINYIWTCYSCETEHKSSRVRYVCYRCQFVIDISCSVKANQKMIHHPSHPHPLVPFISKPILCLCNACGEEHKGIFFQCTTCSNFAVHIDCVFLPKSLLIQETTNGVFHHTHPLTLSYSFPKQEQKTKYGPTCRVCNGDFSRKGGNLWIYKCEKCIYYAHLNCATSRKESFMSIMFTSRFQVVKNFEDADYPHLVRLPFPDQAYNMPRQLLFNEIGPATYDMGRIHRHQLIVVNTKRIDGASSTSETSSLMMCHNPMKKIELLCNGCVRPIMEMPFYKCGANEDETCNFVLHEWCTRLPGQIDNHPDRETFSEYFHGPQCLICLNDVNSKLGYSCHTCGVYIDPKCALLLPETARHAYDKHPMKLNYLPIENHKSEYFCEICENKLNPHSCFYHCGECAQSVHSACAPLILCSERRSN